MQLELHSETRGPTRLSSFWSLSRPALVRVAPGETLMSDAWAGWSRQSRDGAGLDNDANVAEVCQTTWLRLVENLDRIEQPERIGAWLATTSRRESLRIATRSHCGLGDRRGVPRGRTKRLTRSTPPARGRSRHVRYEWPPNGCRRVVSASWCADGR